jgi:CRISPR/Cas system-associated exonuclease Cas4 (RecB family)
MPPDKYTATWVSHSSLSDFIKCPRAYYLKNVYRDPNTKHKIQIMSPALALGQIVHEVLEGLSKIPTDKRMQKSLVDVFDVKWHKVTGKYGGFNSPDQEEKYKQRGQKMMRRVMDNPGPLVNLAVKIKQDLPFFWLSEEDAIILCGKIDWLEYFPDTDSVHIIDFKTSKSAERESSLQLPIYHLLVDRCQQRQVDKASYWYLELEDQLTERKLPDLFEAEQELLKLAKQVKLARQLGRFKCPQGESGCFHCKDFEKILRGESELVSTNEYRCDVHIIPQQSDDEMPESEIL